MVEEGMSQGSSRWEPAQVADPSIFSSKSITYTLTRENAHQTLQLLLDFGSEMKVDSERENIKVVQSFYDFSSFFLLTVLRLFKKKKNHLLCIS